jgi:hypothetical protein
LTTFDIVYGTDVPTSCAAVAHNADGSAAGIRSSNTRLSAAAFKYLKADNDNLAREQANRH